MLYSTPESLERGAHVHCETLWAPLRPRLRLWADFANNNMDSSKLVQYGTTLQSTVSGFGLTLKHYADLAAASVVITIASAVQNCVLPLGERLEFPRSASELLSQPRRTKADPRRGSGSLHEFASCSPFRGSHLDHAYVHTLRLNSAPPCAALCVAVLLSIPRISPQPRLRAHASPKLIAPVCCLVCRSFRHQRIVSTWTTGLSTDVDGDRPFKCPGCPKRLSTYGALVSHERKHRNTSADDALFVPTTRTFSTGRGVLVEEHVPLVRVDSPLLPPLEGEDVVEDSDEESGG
ncbi:unnamed protein product [Closterium sp. Yama58-4]|nr:unnamed protein product [Closterium sp. Yama58-4]